MAGRLEKKIALITGAASGIGNATAQAFAREGAHVWVTDINQQALNNIASNASFSCALLNVSDEEMWKKTIIQIEQKHGRLDILVNNAGIMGLTPEFGPQDPENASLESWHKVLQVNAGSVFLGCKHAIHLMKKNKSGSIVNIGSRSGLVGIPDAAAYAASKAAIRNHTKTVALYCAQKKYNIRCNVIHPASICTPLWKQLLAPGETMEEREAAMAKAIPIGRMGRPEDVAEAVVYFASDESSFVTGTELIIDGGVLAGCAACPTKLTA